MMMPILKNLTMLACSSLAFNSALMASVEGDWQFGKKHILHMAGCHQVDYSFTEVEKLDPAYELDPRLYDASKKTNVKEYVIAFEDGPTDLFLQRILFFTDANNNLSFAMKHHGERWTFEKSWAYDYEGDFKWRVNPLPSAKSTWLREVTALDDGPRYQCSSSWTLGPNGPEWSCNDNYAPIPGRETRDMGRKDYQGLKRATRIISHSWGWLERQNNIKIREENGGYRPIAREEGKVFNIKLASQDCLKAEDWAEKRLGFWALTRAVWKEVLDGQKDFASPDVIDGLARYQKIAELEKEFRDQLDDPQTLEEVKDKIREVIASYRQ